MSMSETWNSMLMVGYSGAGFCMVRFVTGLCEAPFFPGITLSVYFRSCDWTEFPADIEK
jgi:hypothetical protein